MNNNDDNYNPPESDAYAMDDAGRADGPSVAAPTGKNFVMIGLGVIIVGLIAFLLFGGGGGKKDDEEEEELITTDVRSAPTINRPVFNEEITPPAPPPPPPPPVPDEIADGNSGEDTDIAVSPLADPKKKKRYQSGMLITSGVFNSTDLSTGSSKKNMKDIYSAANDNDPNVGFADGYYNQDGVPHAYARKLGNTTKLITQGKIIECVLETPINTDVPGMIRGIVSHDVYGESARNILVPKGSRVVGTYNNMVIRGNKRVNVIWSRVIRPDGIDIMIRSPGTDQLGTAGVEGIVDNKYLEVFSSAFLVSAINIAVAVGVDELDNEQSSTTTTNTDGSTTTNSTAKREAALQAVDLFGGAGKNLIDGALNTNPTITIEQGTRVSIFVNRDLIFPDELLNQIQIVQ